MSWSRLGICLSGYLIWENDLVKMSTCWTLIDFGGLIACVLAAACRGPAADQEARTASREVQPSFVGKAWMSTDPSAASGTLRIFLPDGTLVMDSCGETYRLARWRAIDERRIEWQEDSARIEQKLRRSALTSSSYACIWCASSGRRTTASLRCPSCVPTLGRATLIADSLTWPDPTI
jgi:hypothetical protein